MYHVLLKFKQNRMVKKKHKILRFLTKKNVLFCFVLTIFDKELTPCWKTFLWPELSFNAKLYQFKDWAYHLSVFQKLRHSDTCNRVKSCTKHGRPDQSQRKLTVALNIYTECYF